MPRRIPKSKASRRAIAKRLGTARSTSIARSEPRGPTARSGAIEIAAIEIEIAEIAAEIAIETGIAAIAIETAMIADAIGTSIAATDPTTAGATWRNSRDAR